ncbi:barstar family protein [Ornithinimicrobium pekingense]|uniref:Barstar (barnase inhibitor) domain-containing protein n=1 Tax=Ornithinimicrobium pekingense TaxID=384677 RepID=A0ABQ2F3X3_9MICO|nr:barstar family protein [Ornithinimicrobium pekingense]GGK56787.1 hypothetical protein GCM10011509_01420 [Ornithinimicrobium pekingense]
MHLLPADQLEPVRAHLDRQGYAVASVVTPVEGGLRAAQAEIARTLRLPAVAGTNLDAMADALRDLPQIWGTDQVALLWEDAERLAADDGRAWWILGEILDDAEDLTVVAFGEARMGRPSDLPS